MSERYLVYGLIDPLTKLIRYVGKSSSGMARVKQHRSVLARDQTYKANWIRSLRAAGLQHEECVLESTTSDLVLDAEVWWIAYGKALGWPLTNLTAGGEGALGMSHSKESRDRISVVMKQRFQDPDEIRALSERTKRWWRDNPIAAEAKRERSSKQLRTMNANPARREASTRVLLSLSRESREKATRNRSATLRTPEGRAKMSEAGRERHRRNPGAAGVAAVKRYANNPDLRAKLSASKKEMYAREPERIERMAAGARSRNSTPEAKAAFAARMAAWRSDPVKVAARYAKVRAKTKR
jgi:Spy/CpxP family protein refolding chaperone